MTTHPFEIGVFTIGEITADPTTGRPIDPAVRLREVIELAVMADQAGLDVFGVGEHHRAASRSRHPRWCSPRSRRRRNGYGSPAR